MLLNSQNLAHHLLEKSAQSLPDKVALVHEGVRTTYAQINGWANQLARWLIYQGIQNGDRVILLWENGLEYVITYYGVLKAGAVAVPVSSDTKPDGLRHFLEELGPRVVVSSSRFERLLKATAPFSQTLQALILKDMDLKSWSSVPFSVFPWEDLIQDVDSSNPDIPVEEWALASIVYTSGSTGKPKGVMLSHGNIVSNTHSICQYLNLTDKDIQMVVLPFFYVMGKSLLHTHFAVGGTVVINNKFAFPASVLKQMVEERVTGFSGVPSTYAYLLHRSPLASYRDRFDSLRYCTQAGGHMSRQIKEELRRVLPEHVRIYVMYGATEATARLTYLKPDSFEDKMDSIGKPIPGVTIQVLDTNGQETPTGQVGELVAKGPNIMQGYWKQDLATATVLDKNGYHTGDLGYQDSEGYFYVVGRKDDLLKVGGHRINPQEIEDVLMDTQLVTETAVVGIPDGLLGHKLIAIAVPKNKDCTKNQIFNQCAERLPRYKLPSELKLVKALPKRATGKTDRTRCLQLVA